MKKILLSILISAACAVGAHAQYDYSSASRLDSIENAMSTANSRLAEMRADSIHSSVWQGSGYTNVIYSIASTSTDIYETQKAKFGVALNVGKSFLYPKNHAWGNMVKVGFDIRYIDMQFAMYDKFARPLTPQSYSNNYNSYTGWTGEMTPPSETAGQERGYVVFDQMQILFGAVGVGPTVTVAPLTFLNNAASSLRLNLYFHYQPTLGVNLYKTRCVRANDAAGTLTKDGYGSTEVLAELGYVNLLDWGFKLQWNIIGLGFECRWGSGKLKNSMVEPYYDGGLSYKPIYVNGSDPDKNYTRKFAESRIYIDFAF